MPPKDSSRRLHSFVLLLLLVMIFGVICVVAQKKWVKNQFNNKGPLNWAIRAPAILCGVVFVFIVDQQEFYVKMLDLSSKATNYVGKVLTFGQRFSDPNKFTEGTITAPPPVMVYVTVATNASSGFNLDAIWQALIIILLAAIALTMLFFYFCGPEHKVDALRSIGRNLIKWVWSCENSQSKDQAKENVEASSDMVIDMENIPEASDQPKQSGKLKPKTGKTSNKKKQKMNNKVDEVVDQSENVQAQTHEVAIDMELDESSVQGENTKTSNSNKPRTAKSPSKPKSKQSHRNFEPKKSKEGQGKSDNAKLKTKKKQKSKSKVT